VRQRERGNGDGDGGEVGRCADHDMVTLGELDGHSRMNDEIGTILVRSREDIGLAEKSRQGVGISSYLNVKAIRLCRVSRELTTENVCFLKYTNQVPLMTVNS
jgi:hypothetical protein